MRAYVEMGGTSLVIETLDVMEFGEDGLIVSMLAYWGDGNIREP